VEQYEAALRDSLAQQLGDAAALTVSYGELAAYNQWYAAEHQRHVDDAISAALAAGPEICPTGIFTPWDDDAELIYLSLQRRGLSVPKDMSLVSFGGAWRGSPMREQISAVTVDEEETGRQAARLLHKLSTGEQSLQSAYDMEMPVNFHRGQTLVAPATP
jgi:DNA-binding LacI/PurR family transcriptional regulator